VNKQKLTEAANVLQVALERAALLLAEAVAEEPLRSRKVKAKPKRGGKAADDRRRGRMSPNRLLAKTSLSPRKQAALAAKGIVKVGQARRVLDGRSAPGVTSTRLTPSQKRALLEVLD